MPNIKPGRLWLARKRAGFEQKQVAKLFGHKTTHQISRLERGLRRPNFKQALKFSILYKLPVRTLFPEYFDDCRADLISHGQKFRLDSIVPQDLTLPTDYCSYIELMHSKPITEIDKIKIRKHIKLLMEERQEKILEA